MNEGARYGDERRGGMDRGPSADARAGEDPGRSDARSGGNPGRSGDPGRSDARSDDDPGRDGGSRRRADAGTGATHPAGERMRMPRRLAGALERVVAEEAPATLLAEVQRAWPRACGAAIAARAEPVAERSGTVTIACESGTWAQELELMGEQLRSRIEELVGVGRVAALRFTADLARHR